jgi:DNA-binding FrmR family transcriptional regulator
MRDTIAVRYHAICNIAPYIMLDSPPMSHTVREKAKLGGRVRRIRGQVEALERALETEAGCAQTLQLIASIRGAINGLMAEIMEDHIRVHVVDPARERNADRASAGGELIDAVRAYFR